MSNGVFIAGAWAGGKGATLSSICPATGDTVWQGKSADAKQVKLAITAARAAFTDWSRRPQSARTQILEAYGAALAARSDEIARTIARDMGKALWDAKGEAGAMVGKVALSIASQVERAGSKMTDAAFGSVHLTHRPHGVMAVFGPFNFPGHLPNGHIVPALLAGNTCVFKPSELAPAVAEIMIECFREAGLPDGCVNLVQGARDVGEALLNGDVDGVLFTGSAKTGTAFHRHFAGRPEIMLALEMGGNNPLIIWDPANVDAAADIAAQSAFLTTGQRCSCARRVILPEGAFGDAVVDAIVARAEGLQIGSWDTHGIFMGPLVSVDAAKAAVDFQAMLESKGGEILSPIIQVNPVRGFVTAGVMDVTGARDVPDEELFGPLMQIIRVPSFERAIDVANDTRFGLSGGLVSDDDMAWITASEQMRAGILNRNRPTAGASGTMPFGGPGLSGNQRPSAFYAADYCAWPQASQVSDTAQRLSAQGFPE